MDILDNLALPHPKKPLILTIGNFDGIHLGHQHVLQRVVSLSCQNRTTSGVITFRNSPSEVLSPGSLPEKLCSLPQKVKLLEHLGIDTLFLIEFTRQFSGQSPEEFLQRLLQTIPFSHLILGHDARFGKNREGDFEQVRALAKTLGFEVEYLPPLKVNDRIISSSSIRKEIKAGHLDTAKMMLGRNYSIQSTVTKGTGIGKRIGFPTANVQTQNYCLPPLGVWAVTVNLPSDSHEGIANLGVAPTVHRDGAPILEVHLFDHESVLYDQEIEVFFHKYLRPERQFPSLDALKGQIGQDIQEARSYFQKSIST